MLSFYFETQKKQGWFLTGLCLHLLAAWFSIGFLHPDEHYQVIVPLDLKLTGGDFQSLTWDFHSRIRSWFQIALYYPLGKLLYIFNASPFFVIFVLRLVTCLVSFFSLAYLGQVFLKEEDPRRQLLWCRLLALTWFLPVLQARTNSENLSAAFIFFAIGLLYKSSDYRNFLLSGILAGISFLVRYQMGIVALSLFIWQILIKRSKFKNSLLYCLGVLICLPLGVGLDYWGYGTLTLAPYNYFYHNIILDVASNWGVMPWHFYFTKILTNETALFALVGQVSILLFITKNPKHILVATIVPFVLTHCFIGHKEIRFLILVYLLSVLILTLTISPWKWSRWKRKTAVILVGINLLFLPIATFNPLISSIKFHQWIYERYPNNKTILVERRKDGTHLQLYKFYKRSSLTIRPIDNIEHAIGTLLTGQYSQFQRLRNRKSCRIEHTHYSLKWMDERFNYFNWLSRSSIWVLWECS